MQSKIRLELKVNFVRLQGHLPIIVHLHAIILKTLHVYTIVGENRRPPDLS